MLEHGWTHKRQSHFSFMGELWESVMIILKLIDLLWYKQTAVVNGGYLRCVNMPNIGTTRGLHGMTLLESIP